MEVPDRCRPPAGSPDEDADLLRRFVHGDEAAFATLVRRRIGLVYSVALRQSNGDRHRAEDATQAVFADLARKAASLAGRPVLVGWLYRSAQFAAAGLARAEQRRRAREHASHLMQDANGAESSPDWDKVRPVLDEALGELAEPDRDAILLRFFDGRPMVEIGARLRVTENTARMRVDRALDKLHAVLARRGIRSTSAALGVALAGQAGAAVPGGFAATVAGAALAAPMVTTAAGWASFMTMTKAQMGILGAVAVIGTGAWLQQAKANDERERQLASVQAQHPVTASLRAENQRLAQDVADAAQWRRDEGAIERLRREVAQARQQQSDAAASAAAAAERERWVNQEIERMNREGNGLVQEYKGLSGRAADASRTAAEQAEAKAAAAQKMAEIQAKQREVQAFIAAQPGRSPQMGWTTTPPAGAVRDSSSRSLSDANEQVSLRLPGVDLSTVLSAYEIYSGQKVTRDPSVMQVRGQATIAGGVMSKAEALAALRSALRDQLNVVLETAPDGTVVARRAPGR